MTNTHITIGGHKISAGKTYSTSEVRTGDVWIDGKPIYRKTVSSELPTTTNGSVGHTFDDIATDVDTVIKCYGTHIDTDGKYSLPRFWQGGSAWQYMYINCSAYSTTSNVLKLDVVSTSASRAGQTVYVTIEYTKTTD